MHGQPATGCQEVTIEYDVKMTEQNRVALVRFKSKDVIKTLRRPGNETYVEL